MRRDESIAEALVELWILHVLVSVTGQNTGYIDTVLAEKGLSRRVALSVPHFMSALAAIADTDLVAAIPSNLVEAHAFRFGLGSVKAPLALRRWQLRAIAPKAAMADPGVAWLFEAVAQAAKPLGLNQAARSGARVRSRAQR